MPFPESAAARAGRFTAIRPLAGGAHGRVYFARDNLGRAVAVKEALPDDAAFVALRARFRTEARVQAALQHPAIVPVYQLEEDAESGELYLVCAYADGGSLADRLRHGVLSAAEALLVARDIGAALEATWGLRIVHRDVKPANILLFGAGAPGGAALRARLGDFGVAQDQRRRRTTLLPEGSHPGTPLYMAPEQARMVNLLDVRADLYALGVSLWEALTGEDYKLLAVAGPPDLARLRPDLPPGLGPALAGALANDPAARYSDPLELARAIERALHPGPARVAETIDLGRGPSVAPVAPAAGAAAMRGPALAQSPPPVPSAGPWPPQAPLAQSRPAADQPPGPVQTMRPFVAAGVNTMLALLSGLLWATLRGDAARVVLAAGLPLFLALLFLRRDSRPLGQRVALALGAFAACIGSFRAVMPGDALAATAESSGAQVFGLMLTLGAGIWAGRSLGQGAPVRAAGPRAGGGTRAVRVAAGVLSALALLAHLPLLAGVRQDEQSVLAFGVAACLSLVCVLGWRRGLSLARWAQLLVGGLTALAGLLHAGLSYADGPGRTLLAMGVAALGLLAVALALRGVGPEPRALLDGARRGRAE